MVLLRALACATLIVGVSSPLSAATCGCPDTTPPVVSCHVATSSLWPPNHRMVDVGLKIRASDNRGIADLSVSISQDEPCNDIGDGNFAPDAEVGQDACGCWYLRVRAERQGPGDGRVYLILVTATDAAGNATTTACTVVVPHDQSRASVLSVVEQAAAAKAALVPLAYDSTCPEAPVGSG